MSATERVARPTWGMDAPLLAAATAATFGPTLVIAPHPDDEVLGCGGTIALLKKSGTPVRVVIVSDGGASHPLSQRYPRARIRAMRQAESLAGLASLGVDSDAVTFLDLPDGALPEAVSASDGAAKSMAVSVLRAWPEVETVLLPWRRDPHPDHRASWALFTAALDATHQSVRRLEYPIWTLVHPEPGDPPQPGEAHLSRLDISAVQVQKRAAIRAHRSQTTDLIDDDPTAFCLTPAVLAHFDEPWELFMAVGTPVDEAPT